MKKPILVSILTAVSLVSPLSAGKSSGVIASWTDGDTVRVRLDAGIVSVRLVGIDAPEVNPGPRGDEQAQRLGISRRDLQEVAYAAKAAAQRLAPSDTHVVLETDVQSHDRYGRLLAYLWLPNGLMVNEQLILRGYALLLTIPPNVKYVNRFIEAQRLARSQGRGLWASPGPPQPVRRGNCDPAYPTVCIPSPPPDLDCGEVPYRNFRVLPPDPHRFDGDRDGVGCES